MPGMADEDDLAALGHLLRAERRELRGREVPLRKVEMHYIGG